MVYLSHFDFPDKEKEYDFRMSLKRTCYDTIYPFFVLSKNETDRLSFDTVTILYGGNGSGKSTALNIIAEKLKLSRTTRFNRTCFFDQYTELCDYGEREEIPEKSCIITSDDVFDFMLNLRAMNEGVDIRREELTQEYLDAKYQKFQMHSMEDYEQLRKVNQARKKTQSQFIRDHLAENVREHSNGESAFLYFQEKIKEDGLYLLDEPENSLSPEKQQELLKFLEDSARFFGCQFIIATHSPFLLSMKGARIYDMDDCPVGVKKWTALPNVKTYYDFFRRHQSEFEND